MYLKNLQVRGFKTFSGLVEINFHPRINIIVGPNGCGKSNLADAVRWALGENNVRHLRGNKSEDIIFHGTDQKKAQSMAMVELLIDNGDYELSAEYSELVINRKAFRTGESEFSINKAKVRLKDINKLLAGTGLGKKGYSIIGQGELEQVLNGQPLERRLILEEASGVIKYRQQRDEVNLRIESTVNNLVRLKDILFEVAQRKEELRLKAEKAAQYQELNREFNETGKKILANEMALLRDSLSKSEQEMEEKKRQRDLLAQSCEDGALALESQERLLKRLDHDIRALQEEKAGHSKMAAALQTDLKLCEERRKNNNERKQQALEDKRKYHHLLRDFHADLEIKIAGLKMEKELLQEKQADYERLDAQQQKTASFIEKQNQEFAHQKQRLFNQSRRETELSNSINLNDSQIKAAHNKSERLNDKISETAGQIKHFLLGLTEIQQTQRDNIRLQQKLTGQLTDKDGKITQLTGIRRKIESEYNLLQEEKMNLTGRMQFLDNMDRNMAGYSPAVKQLLRAAENRELIGIMGVMGEIIEVPDGMETAVEMAAGRRLENIVVDKETNAQAAVTWLKEGKKGRLTFLPLEILRVTSVPANIEDSLLTLPGVLGIGSRLIGCDPVFNKALEYLLGRVVIIDNMINAGLVFKKLKYPFQLVTLEGEIINTSGAISGGSKGERQQNSPLQRKGERLKLEKLIGKNRKLTEQNRSVYQDIVNQSRVLERESIEIRNQQTEVTYKCGMLAKEIKYQQEILDRKKEEMELFNKEITALLKEKAESERLGQILKEDCERLARENRRLNTETEKSKEENDKLQMEYEIAGERLRALNQQLLMKRKELAGTETNIQQFQQIHRSYEKSEAEATELETRLEAELIAAAAQRERLISELNTQYQTEEQLKCELDALLREERDAKEKIHLREREIKPLKPRLSILDEECRRHENALIRKETEWEILRAKWREQFDSTQPGELVIEFSHAELLRMKSRLAELKESIELLGPVDLASIDEYEEAKKRFEFLNAQCGDLERANISLNNLLHETEKLMDKDYKDFFKLANQSFQRTCAEIFSGGEALLKHEDGKAALETGIILEIKMPGKRPQALNLLSGGERALLCIAFIFALMRLKPVPFCLLDEIDAALDENNLRRFVNFIKMMAAETQFLIITHRQPTIECGDHIYGVTMQEKGVSAILTLKIDEDPIAV
ncbi:MAG: chromosome segregation protein SMC [Syntrophomonadaceae bacterium]|jgi:chromosome segregation protein|nr:chromosome segregation protein SMC [Syntrophomonadaceae bacterium]